MGTRLYFTRQTAPMPKPTSKQSNDTIHADYATLYATYANPALMTLGTGTEDTYNYLAQDEPGYPHFNHYGTWVSQPLPAQDLSGTVSLGLVMRDSISYLAPDSLVVYPRVKIYIWKADNSLGDDILPLTTSTTAANDGETNVVYFDAVTINSVHINNGDKIVIEIESYDDNTLGGLGEGGWNQGLRFGGQAAAGVAPVASFTATPTSGTTPLSVTFNNTSTGTEPLTYEWDFNNTGFIGSTEKNPVGSYSATGFHSPKLTVTNAYGSHSVTRTNYIEVQAIGGTAPVAAFSASVTSGDFPLAVTFTNASTGTAPLTYKWYFDGGSTVHSTATNPTHTYTAAGTYTVKLTVTNEFGTDDEIKTGYITITTPAEEEDYGCGTTYDGNPIGGGVGYSSIYSAATATYVVTSKAAFLARMTGGATPATSGQVVFIPTGTTIDLTGEAPVYIPAGVTIASDRGTGSNAGGVITKTSGNRFCLIVGGANVRVTGLQIVGEEFEEDGEGSGEFNYMWGITNGMRYVYAYDGYAGLVVDNCEIRGWSWSGVHVHSCATVGRPVIKNNYIHHCQARSEGYGVDVDDGNCLIAGNIFDYNRHSVTGGGYANERYECCYNHHLGHGNAIGACHFDVHEEQLGAPYAGNEYHIHHNTVDDCTCCHPEEPDPNDRACCASLHVRHNPITGVYFTKNLINTWWGAYGSYNKSYWISPFRQTTGTVRVYCTDNKWHGTVYAGNSGFLWVG